MKWAPTAAVAALAFALGSISSDAQTSPPPFDVDRYQPATLTDVVARQPSASGVSVVRDIPIRAKVVYSGQFRGLPADTLRVLEAWSMVMRVPLAGTTFHREVLLHEGPRAFWVPVQEVLVPAMQDELERGEIIQVFAIYIGQIDGRHVFLINAFDHEGPHRPRRR